MWAERAVAKIDRDYDKAIRKMNELKNSMDEAQRVYDAKQEGRAEGRQEEKQNIINLLKSGKSTEEIIQLMENE